MLTSLVREHWGWASTSGFFGLVLIRVLVVSRLDVVTGSALLAEGGFVQVTLSVALLLVPFLLGVVACVLAVRLFLSYGSRRFALLVATLVTCVVIWNVAPAVTGGIVLAFVLVAWLGSSFNQTLIMKAKSLWKDRMVSSGLVTLEEFETMEQTLQQAYEDGKTPQQAREGLGWRWREGLGEFSLMLALLPALPLLIPTAQAVTSATPWLPAEQIILDDSEILIGYVLSSGEWVSILREEDRRIVRVSGERVAERKLCSVDPRPNRWESLAMAIRQSSPPGDGYPECDAPA